MRTTIPGLKAQHAIIKPNCVKVHGSRIAAFNVAMERLRAEYIQCAAGPGNADAWFHLVLTVEPSKDRE